MGFCDPFPVPTFLTKATHMPLQTPQVLSGELANCRAVHGKLVLNLVMFMINYLFYDLFFTVASWALVIHGKPPSSGIIPKGMCFLL